MRNLNTTVSLIDTADSRRNKEMSFNRGSRAVELVQLWHDDHHTGGFTFCGHELCAAISRL